MRKRFYRLFLLIKSLKTVIMVVLSVMEVKKK